MQRAKGVLMRFYPLYAEPCFEEYALPRLIPLLLALILPLLPLLPLLLLLLRRIHHL